MWFWRERYYQALQEAVAAAGAFPEWAAFAAYCTDCQSGLRRQAFAKLDQFIAGLEGAAFAERQRFIRWLLRQADPRDGCHLLLPHPLRQRVILPTLEEWTRREPAAPEPHRWLGGREHLQRALELDPKDELARSWFIDCILQEVGYDIHELPGGYLGNPEEDLAALAEAARAADACSQPAARQSAHERIGKLRRVIEDHRRGRSNDSLPPAAPNANP
jgi:hypothetical protein